MAMFIPADPTQPTREVFPKDKEDGFSLQELYTLLSCDTIEVVYLPSEEGQIMIVDEEGKLAQKPRNERATKLAQFVSPKEMVEWLLAMKNAGVPVIRVTDEPLTDLTEEVDYIVGDALVCLDGEELK